MLDHNYSWIVFIGAVCEVNKLEDKLLYCDVFLPPIFFEAAADSDISQDNILKKQSKKNELIFMSRL